MANELRVVGPPGCGKTTYLSRQVRQAVEARGSQAVMIASLTKAAAQEVAGRGLPIAREQVGTLHAHAYRALDGPKIADSPEGIKAWNEENPSMQISGGSVDTDSPMEGPRPGSTPGDELFSQMNLLRARMVPRSQWGSLVTKFATKWQQWKTANGLLDFTDLLEHALWDVPEPLGQAETLFVDEAQDMDRLSMSLARKWGEAMGRLVVVGDPDQAIYEWRGGDPDVLTTPVIPADHRRVLSQSYRVPRAVHEHAVSWIDRIYGREPVVYQPRDAEGEVRRCDARWKYPESLLRDSEQYLSNGKTVMVLAACSYMLNPLLAVLRQEGIPFHNPWRRKRGDWNPLQSSRGVPAWQRLTAYLRMDGKTWDEPRGSWTAEDLQMWTKALKARDVLAVQRDALDTLPGGELPWDLLNTLLSDAAIDGGLAADLDWFESQLLSTYQNSMAFPLTVARKQGAAKLHDAPLLTVGTIHSTKGGEADVVYVFPDLSREGAKMWTGSPRDQAAIIRQFYVAFTRARDTLVLCEPATRHFVE